MTGPSGAARDSGLDDEDRKLVVLARGALGRTQSGAGAEAGRGQKGRAASPLDRSGQRWNRRQELRRV